MLIEVDKRCLQKEKLKISLFDENTTRADIPLGFGIASVTQLCRAVLTERKIKVDLCDEKGAACGTVFLNAILLPSKVEVRTYVNKLLKVPYQNMNINISIDHDISPSSSYDFFFFLNLNC